jgi:hypothetical protein
MPNFKEIRQAFWVLLLVGRDFLFFSSIHRLNSLLLIAGLLSVDCSIKRSSELLGFWTFSTVLYSRN